MRYYYRGPEALITNEHFVWQRQPEHVFAVTELRNVGIVRTSAAPSRRQVTFVTGSILVAAAAATSAGFGYLAVMATATLAVILTVTATAAAGRIGCSWHLQATYFGSEMLLFSSADERVFNQVARALQRTIEDSRRRRNTTYGLAAA